MVRETARRGWSERRRARRMKRPRKRQKEEERKIEKEERGRTRALARTRVCLYVGAYVRECTCVCTRVCGYSGCRLCCRRRCCRSSLPTRLLDALHQPSRHDLSALSTTTLSPSSRPADVAFSLCPRLVSSILDRQCAPHPPLLLLLLLLLLLRCRRGGWAAVRHTLRFARDNEEEENVVCACVRACKKERAASLEWISREKINEEPR